MHLLLRGTEDADVICPVLFPFPLLALYAGPEVRDSGRLRAGNSEKVYRWFLKRKTKDAGVCGHMCECVCLIFNFLKRKKGPILICLLESSFAFVQTLSFLKISFFVFLSLSPLIMYILLVFLYQMVFLFA